MIENKPKVSNFKAWAIFIYGTTLFIFVGYVLIPWLITNCGLNKAISWFAGGGLLFVALFIAALVFTRLEGCKTKREIFERLHIKPLSKNDALYIRFGSLLILLSTGLIMTLWSMLATNYSIPAPSTNPPFLTFKAFAPDERWFLLVWAPMFFFNIAGEEMLWRGYIQLGQEGKSAWLLNSLLWAMFHLPFGLKMLITLVPILIILPYCVHKTRNTSVGMAIHAILNGPSFILISLGMI